MNVLFPALHEASPRPALRFEDRILSYRQLATAAGALAERLRDTRRVAVWATPTWETAVGVVAALVAGVPAVPLNPRVGERELAHILADSAPDMVLAATGTELPDELAALPRVEVDPDLPGATGRQAAADGVRPERTTADGAPESDDEVPTPPLPPEPHDETAALIVYTSGTTGAPKGVVIPRRAIRETLDGLRTAWCWSEDDVLAHALPLFHVHGLVLGVLGPLRQGGSLWHLGRFTVEGVTRALSTDATMLFGVPTMYHRLAQETGTDVALARALARARLLVSGSAPMALTDHERLHATTGRRVLERYGMTETLMNTSVRADGDPATGTVGTALPGVFVRLVAEDGERVAEDDDETIGEVQVRGPNLFVEYLNRPEDTAAAFDGGWFRTGDLATRDTSGNYRLVGRKATDLIKSGGYRIGAGEVENALLAHPSVAEAAVTGEPDADLGERLVAWVVPAPGETPAETDLIEHVSRTLTPHKRPRVVRFLETLPRNDMGKILKRRLIERS